MTMNRRRLMLAIGAALLVGGWGATRYATQADESYHRFWSNLDAFGEGEAWKNWTDKLESVYIGGFVSMAVGAGLVGFAVLRPTTRNEGSE